MINELKLSRDWFKNSLLPRVVFLPFWIMRILPISFGLRRQASGKNHENLSTKICIEAGVIGWKSIEFKELHASACEYLGTVRVHKLEVKKGESYIQQVKAALDQSCSSHYIYDPRTGSQKWHLGLLQSFRVALLLHLRGIVPIALLTDFSHRLWRAQSALVTARRGVVISFLAAKDGFRIFPHGRLVAPSLMPLSKGTMVSLNLLAEQRPGNPLYKALFIGSLYEPRTTVLRSVAEKLKSRGLTLEIKGRIPGAPRIPDPEYWSMLSHSALIITTADQIELPINDWKWIKQLTYRYLEAMASGTLLVAPEVPGIRRYFVPGEHFVSFNSPAHAAEVIEYYLINEAARSKIAEQGRARAQALVEARTFWVCIDIGLGRDSLT